MKGKAHKEYYVKYIATHDGVEKIQMSHGDKPATKKQKELIEKLMVDYPDSKAMFEYEDYMDVSNRENASELISAIMDQNITDVATKENYVDYIANRPRVERLGEHGLFGDAGKQIHLEEVVKAVGEHKGNVWTHIISLKREDASRLGFDNAQSWMDLCRAKRNELAEAMKILPDNLEWYAAFHNEGHHPHIHMVVYSKNDREGYLTLQGIGQIRSMFAGDIFHQDLMHIYKGQTEIRDELKQYSKAVIQKQIMEMDHVNIYENSIIIQKLQELKESLINYHGRTMYAYIPQASKQIINDIMRELEKEEHVQALYEQWKLYKQNVQEAYHDHLQEQLPLLEQKEFKSIKNMILHEVMAFDENKVTYNEQQYDMQESDHILHDEGNEIIESEDVENSSDLKSSHYKMEWSKKYKQASKLFYGSEEVEQDMDVAKALLEEECEEENILAYELLARLYEMKKEDEDTISDLYKAVLEGGMQILEEDDSEFAQSYLKYKIGKLYYYGKGCEQDYGEAFRYFTQSDNQYAMYSLGTMYQRGLYVEQNNRTAFAYFEKAAQKVNPFAAYQVGKYYEEGIGVEQNNERSDKYYKIAFDEFHVMIKKQEDDHLLYRLGEMAYHGKGVEKNVPLAMQYLEKAVSFENQNAKYLLAKIYLEESDFAHIPEAVQWLEELDTPQAWYLLGKEYEKGIILEKDIGKAIYYLEKCAEQENAYAIYKLAKIYLRDPLYHDNQKAIHYLQRSATLGNEFAQFMLGNELLKGEIIEKNVEEAVYHLSRSASQNNMFAQYILGKLFLFGKDVEQDKEKAIEYLTLSAQQGNEHAKYLLEHMNDYQTQPLALVTSRFFHHLSKIFTNTLPYDRGSPLAGVDKKLALKIKQKKIAQGHNAKDHEIHAE